MPLDANVPRHSAKKPGKQLGFQFLNPYAVCVCCSVFFVWLSWRFS